MSYEKDLLSRYEKVRNDPWEFFKAVRTLDQVDAKNPVKHFPVHLDYIKLVVRVLARERLVALPKTRRMKMSWTCITFYVWDTVFRIGKSQAFVSKKEDDSNELCERADFILKNLDEEIVPRELIPKHDFTYNKIKFVDTNSLIQGFPSGANQLRQFTFSGILADEMAFWDNAQEMYSGAFPTIEGGGRFTALSSVAPGFFKYLVFDKLDELSGGKEDDGP